VRVIVDVGGGSTEVIKGSGSNFEFGQSIDIGCVRLTEMFIKNYPVTAENLNKLKTYIQQQISAVVSQIKKHGPVDEILAVAGTPTEIARIELGRFDPALIDGYVISKERLQNWMDKFSCSKVEDIIANFGVSAGRADVILVGVTILSEICQALDKEQILVSTRGVRFGIALELE
jgi:exopolyphosphatase/guanosine-5'-triphosphate,3'-diphosphate pyrophosphatase